MKDKIEFIAFDADDTLWESELYIQEFEHKFCNLLRQYLPASSTRTSSFRRCGKTAEEGRALQAAHKEDNCIPGVRANWNHVRIGR